MLLHVCRHLAEGEGTLLNLTFRCSQVLSTDHELIPSRNTSLAVMHSSGAEVMFVIIQRENICPSKKEMNKAGTMLKQPDVCSWLSITTSLYRWPIGSFPSTCMLGTARTALRMFTPRRDKLAIDLVFLPQYQTTEKLLNKFNSDNNVYTWRWRQYALLK
jgi:hypothetical protein